MVKGDWTPAVSRCVLHCEPSLMVALFPWTHKPYTMEQVMLHFALMKAKNPETVVCKVEILAL